MVKKILTTILFASSLLSLNAQTQNNTQQVTIEDKIEILDSNKDGTNDGLILIRGNDIRGEINVGKNNTLSIYFSGEKQIDGYKMQILTSEYKPKINFNKKGLLVSAKYNSLNKGTSATYNFQDKRIVISGMNNLTLNMNHRIKEKSLEDKFTISKHMMMQTIDESEKMLKNIILSKKPKEKKRLTNQYKALKKQIQLQEKALNRLDSKLTNVSRQIKIEKLSIGKGPYQFLSSNYDFFTYVGQIITPVLNKYSN